MLLLFWDFSSNVNGTLEKKLVPALASSAATLGLQAHHGVEEFIGLC